ncbi:ribonuclease H-like domain-containing protein [Clostridium sp. JNZ J1-5]
MYIKEQEKRLSINKKIYKHYEIDKVIFYDIETTGFDREKSNIVLISGGYFIDDNTFIVKQYFAENLEDEKEVLLSFKKDLEEFNAWCSYNGKAFDEPFIKKKMELNNIDFMEPKVHLDLYRMIRPYHKQLGIERCNLKSVERYLGIERKDQIDGGLSVELYYEFLETENHHLREIIMLHNYEDVLNLPIIFKLIHEIENNNDLKRENSITEKQLSYLKYLMKKNKIVIEADIEKISKKAASRIIDNILKGNLNIDEFNNIVNNSY